MVRAIDEGKTTVVASHAPPWKIIRCVLAGDLLSERRTAQKFIFGLCGVGRRLQSRRNPTVHDIASLKKMTPIQRKTYEISQLKKSFDAAIEDGSLRVPVVSERAVELFEGDVASAEKWLAAPNRALGWKTPAEMLFSQSGIDEVLGLIARISHGVYS